MRHKNKKSHVVPSFTRLSIPVLAILATGAAAMIADATPGPSRIVPFEEFVPTISSLKGVKPLRPNLDDYIVDRTAAQQLGKALFWDVQVGSDGLACASCHFHAGADIRTKNQVNPGGKAGDSLFNARHATTGNSGPNKAFAATDFPFHLLDNVNDRESNVAYDTNDVFSSEGAFGGDFISIGNGVGQKLRDLPSGWGFGKRFRDSRASLFSKLLSKISSGNGSLLQSISFLAGFTVPKKIGNETCSLSYDPQNNPFHANNLIYRKVEPRQTPPAINAVFNVRQFWDGRANNEFNGVDPFGPRTYQPLSAADGAGDPRALKTGILVADPSLPASKIRMRLLQPLIANSSLASQAVGPPLSDFEMSCANKTFADLGRKLTNLRPLAGQRVSPDDSLFAKTRGLVALGRDKGLNASYRALIEKAFNRKFWADPTKVTINDAGVLVRDMNGYTQMEHNFSLFWGLAIQEYESLLISDDSPFDRYMNGDKTALSDEAQAGQVLFVGKAGCVNCHSGPLLSNATVTANDKDGIKSIEHMFEGNGYAAFYDAGFYNIGVRPTVDDKGVGGTDPYGFDLSYTRQYKWQLVGQQRGSPDHFAPTPCRWVVQFWPCTDVPKGTDPLSSERDAVDGAFKVPILRNVGLTPPYFHNGGQATLKDVVRFYSRGGDRRGPPDNDSSGLPTPNPFGQVNTTNLDPDVGELLTVVPSQHNALGLTDREIDYLVQFLLSLTDDRVACHSSIFDHPELPLLLGQDDAANRGAKTARDIVSVLPAVGVTGLRGIGKPCFPNSGDLFNSVNTASPAPLQQTFKAILVSATATDIGTTAGGTTNGGTTAGSGTTAGVGATAGNPGTGGNTGTGAGTGTGTGTSAGATGTGGATGGVLAALAVPTLPPPVPATPFSAGLGDIHGFTSIGFIRSATITDESCPGAAAQHWGGTAVVNGNAIVIPCYTVVQMPAATFVWADLFDPSKFRSTQSPPASLPIPSSGSIYGPGQFSFPSTEIRVEGNIVAGRYIAALVYVSQQSLNTGSGYIVGFDYPNGVILIGSSPAGPAKARLQLNDPNGRFSKGQSPDTRFSVDDQNPTIHAASGYPMCVPRDNPFNSDGSIAPDRDDPLCPQRNRPLAAPGCRNFAQAGVRFLAGRDFSIPPLSAKYCGGFVMGDPVTASPDQPLSTQQAPFEIGDLITYSGTLLEGDGSGPNGSDTVSVHTITADVGIFTQPGTLPVYLATEEFSVTTYDPATSFNGVPLEAPDRLVLVANVTDVTSIVDIYLVDIDPATGTESQRWVTPGSMTSGVGAFGSNGRLIDGGITTQLDGPVPGRVRIRANKAVPGILTSATRYVRVVARSLCDPANINATAPLVSQPAAAVTCLQRAQAANGLYSGQYLAPTFEFLFPENVNPGDPLVPKNFWDMGFLVNGEGPGTGRLSPTPW